jgi:hypothetical protein
MKLHPSGGIQMIILKTRSTFLYLPNAADHYSFGMAFETRMASIVLAMVRQALPFDGNLIELQYI